MDTPILLRGFLELCTFIYCILFRQRLMSLSGRPNYLVYVNTLM